MRVIFLDIDGVLNSKNSPYEINERCVKRLAKIVKKTEAKIVISSNWRHIYKQYMNKEDMDFRQQDAIFLLLSLFERNSLSIYDITSIVGYDENSRPLEIKEYISNRPVDSYVILDDEEMWNWNDLKDHLVLTCPNGLEHKHIKEAITKLEREIR